MVRRDALKQILVSGTSLLVLNESLIKNAFSSRKLLATLTIDLNDPRFSALKNINGTVEITNAIAPGIQNELQANYPLALVRVDTNSVSALEKFCMHQGCEVNKYDGTRFQCPCHGSQYSATGSVLRGPTTQPLKNYQSTLAGSILTVNGLSGNTNWNLTSIESPSTPTAIELHQNYPNPFGTASQSGNLSTRITYIVGVRTHINLSIYDQSGKLVSVLVDSIQNPGTHNIDFDAAHLTSGTYFYTLRAGNYVESKRMVHIK